MMMSFNCSYRNKNVNVCQFLQGEKKSACVLLYVGGVKVSKKIREYEVGADEFLEFFVVTHEEGRHELACPPPVDVSCGHQGSSACTDAAYADQPQSQCCPPR